jgi:hypothetical protein
MIGTFSMRALQSSALLVTALLAGCASSSGLGGLALLGEGTQAAQASPDGQVQVATLSPGETPPLPTRRPGKRPRASTATAKANAAPPQPSPTPEAAPKSEGSGFSLASLGQIDLFSSTATPEKAAEPESGPDSILVSQPPVAAYSVLAQRIKYCWLNPTSPRLPNHGFHAEMAPGEIKEAKMVVYEKAPDGRRGTSVFKIDITAETDGALVSSHNVRLEKATEAGFKADLARWAKGDERCKV